MVKGKYEDAKILKVTAVRQCQRSSTLYKAMVLWISSVSLPSMTPHWTANRAHVVNNKTIGYDGREPWTPNRKTHKTKQEERRGSIWVYNVVEVASVAATLASYPFCMVRYGPIHDTTRDPVKVSVLDYSPDQRCVMGGS